MNMLNILSEPKIYLLSGGAPDIRAKFVVSSLSFRPSNFVRLTFQGDQAAAHHENMHNI